MHLSLRRAVLLAALLLGAGAPAWAQAVATPQNVLQLSAAGTVEVQQDLLAMTLSTTRDGADAAAVQSQLKSAVESALAEAKRTAQPGQMEVRTGNFALYPRSGRDGRIAGWTGTAEVVLEGRDFGRITQAAGRIQGLTVANVQFSLSREQRNRVEGDAQAIAIERFQARAAELARAFGFAGYGLREVSVQTGAPGFVPRPRTMALEARAAAADTAAVPVEAGRTTVTVTVSGTVQLR